MEKSSPLLPIQIIGASCSGGAFHTSANDGAMLKKIWVWVGESQIRGIKIWFTDGQSQQFGKAIGTYQGYKFETGETITSMSLWGNGAGTRLGGIKFNTSKDGKFFAKMTVWGLKQEYAIDVGSGICTGVMGRSGAEIDSFGFVFIKPIKESVMTKMNYPTIGKEAANVQPSTIRSELYDNTLDVEQSRTFKATEERTTKKSWSVSASIEATYHVSVKAGVPTVGEIEAGYSLTVGVEGTYGVDESTKTTESWEYPLKIPPKTKVEAILSQGYVNISLPYSAVVEVTTTDGSVLSFNQRGVYNGVTYTKNTFAVKAL